MNIFIDTQNMEERYGEELYKEYLENQNKEMKEKINKAKEYMKTLSDEYATNDYDIKCDVFNKLYYEILGDKENENIYEKDI